MSSPRDNKMARNRGIRGQPTISASTATKKSPTKTTHAPATISPGVVTSSGPKTYRKQKDKKPAGKSTEKLVVLILAFPRGVLVFLVSLYMSLESLFEVATNATLNGIRDFKTRKASNAEKQLQEIGEQQAERLRIDIGKPGKKGKKAEGDKQIAETTNSSDREKKKQRPRSKTVREDGKTRQQAGAGDTAVLEGDTNAPVQTIKVIENTSDDEVWTRVETTKTKRARRKQLSLVQDEDKNADKDIDDKDDPHRSGSRDDSDVAEVVRFENFGDPEDRNRLGSLNDSYIAEEELEDVSDQEHPDSLNDSPAGEELKDVSDQENPNDSGVADEMSEDMIDQASVYSENVSVKNLDCSEDSNDLDVAGEEEDEWTQMKYNGLKRSVSAPSIVQAAPDLVRGRYSDLAEDSEIDKEMTTEVAELSSLTTTPTEGITPSPLSPVGESEEVTPKPAKSDEWKPAGGVFWSDMEDMEEEDYLRLSNAL